MTRYFNDTCNVLTNIERVSEFPFPYSGAKPCLPDDLYDTLSKARPPWQAIAAAKKDKNNVRADLCARDALASKTLDPIWKDFIEYHTSNAFYHQILDLFEGYFVEFYPELKGIMRGFKTAVRYSGKEADIYLDCQLSVNTPVKEKSTVNHPHYDNPQELWASLLYMKEPDDNAGGHLLLHKCIASPTFHGRREADLQNIRPWGIIDYASNSYVCFINSPVSIHSVTEREITDKPRLMVNISLEFKGGIF